MTTTTTTRRFIFWRRTTERVRGALAVALAVFPTYKKRRRARTLVEWALVLDVLEDMGTTEGQESEDGDGRWSSCQAHSSIPPTIGFLSSSMVYNAQERRAETPRLQRGQKLSQALPPPVRVLGACEAGKATRMVLIGCRGRAGPEGSLGIVANFAKNAIWRYGTYMVDWVRDDSKHRQ